jgi:tetratricopeptide (TPR) repeat protein
MSLWVILLLSALGWLFIPIPHHNANARSPIQAEMDSLYQALNKAEKPDLLEGYLMLAQNYLYLAMADSTEKYLLAAEPLLHHSTRQAAYWHKLKATQQMLLGNMESALGIFDKASALYKQSGEEPELAIASILTDKGKIYTQLNRFDSAFYYNRAALAHLRKVPQNKIDSSLISLIYNNMGALYFYENQLDSAQEYYDRARTIAIMHQGDSSYAVGRTLYNIGLVREAKGYFTDAIFFYDKALDIYRKHFGEEHTLVAEVYGGLGSAYLNRNEIERAIYYFEKDQSIVRKLEGETHPNMAWGYENLGRAFLEKQQPEQAIHYLKKALQLREAAYGKVHTEIVDNLKYLAEASQADPLKSIQLARRALETDFLLTRLPTFRKSDALLILSRLYAKTGNKAEAIQAADSALAVLEKLVKDGRHPSLALARLQKSEVYMQQGRLEMAFLWADKAIDATTEAEYSRNEGHPADVNQLLFEKEYLQCLLLKTDILNKYFARTKDVHYLNKILALCHEAIPVISRMQYLQTSEDAQPATDALFESIYENGIKTGALLYQATREDKYLKDIFFFAEQMKNRSLAASVRAIDLLGVADVPETTLRREYQLKKDILYYRSLLEDSQEPSSGEGANARENLTRLYAEQERFYNNMRRHHPAYMKMRYVPEPLSIEYLQKKILRQEELMVHFTRAGDFLHVLLVGDNKIKYVQYSIQDWDAGRLFEVISQYKDIRKLIWIPDPCMSGFMPEAVRTGNTFALEKYAFIYNSSAFLYARKPENEKTNNQQILAFAPVSFRQSGLPDLLHSEREIKMITSAYKKVKSYLKDNATAANFLKEMQAYPILHLATHAEMEPNLPLKSRLYFYADTAESQVVYAHQLFGKPMRAKMVALSACRTADTSGLLEGAAGIAAAFAYNGCRNILMSTQQQDDRAAMEIMSAFYKNMSEGMDKAVALQQAKLAYLKKADRYRSSPQYWAGIILTGDYERFHLKPPSFAQRWWIPALLAFFLALLYSSKGWVRLRV